MGNQKPAQIKVIRPDNSQDIINLTDKVLKDYLTYSNTNLAGHYKFFAGDDQIEDISINTDPNESKTVYATSSDFENYLKEIKFNGQFVSIDKDSNILNRILQARFGSELWRYFLLIAILLALVEMTIARNSKKDLEGLNT